MNAQSQGEMLRAGLVVVSCLTGLTAFQCAPKGGGGNTPTTTAASQVSFKMSASGAPKCTSDLRWEWEPVKLTGTQGSTAKYTEPSSGFTAYDVSSQKDGDTTICLMNGGGANAFATGTWRITLVNAVLGPIAQCEVTLRAGSNWAGFRQSVTTCKETPPGSIGFQYP